MKKPIKYSTSQAMSTQTATTIKVAKPSRRDAKTEPVLSLTLSDTTSLRSQHEVIMIGAGPAALTAAIYTTREDIETLIYERGVIGGLAATTDRVDNYPGFPDGVDGLELADRLRLQAERFGAHIELGEITAVKQVGSGIEVKTTDGSQTAQAILIATGTDYKKLGIPGEDTYYARGVHYCATCDGALYRDKRLVVVGGGNSAVQEALFLTRYASHIDLLVRSQLRASDILKQELLKDHKITLQLGVKTDEIIGDGQFVKAVIGSSADSGQPITFDCDGVFVFVGFKPSTGFLRSSGIQLDEQGFIVTDQTMQTNMSGVFAAGDVRSGANMQIASAVGEGATAALHIREYLLAKQLSN